MVPPGLQGTLDCTQQAMPCDGSIESRIGRFAFADALGQSHVHLGDIIRRPRRTRSLQPDHMADALALRSIEYPHGLVGIAPDPVSQP